VFPVGAAGQGLENEKEQENRQVYRKKKRKIGGLRAAVVRKRAFLG
jgi:hypothetical protein